METHCWPKGTGIALVTLTLAGIVGYAYLIVTHWL